MRRNRSRRHRISTSDVEIDRAIQRAKGLHANSPHAVSARYDRASGKVVIELSSKLTLSFSPHDAQGLENATPARLEEIELSPSGFGVHFPKIDADLYIPGLLEGLMGSKNWMAARLGQAGGQSRSRAKKAPSRANGLKGGRPRRGEVAEGD
ncbi:MAG: DUF2442 domain-containing protein [Terriglobales bacterium]|jgi:hypothetical protein